MKAPALSEHEARLAKAMSRIESLRESVEAFTGEPGNPEPGADDWVPGQVLAHCAEFVPFWLGELERVLDDERQPAPFGRVQGDTVRIAMIRRDGTLPPRELLSRLRAEVDRARMRLLELTDEQAARRGVHSTLGEMDVAGLVEEFLSGHLEAHADQLEKALATSG